MSSTDELFPERSLLLGVCRDNLIVLPEALVRAVTDDLAAIWKLSTYGEARRFEGQFMNAPGVDDEEWEESDRSDDDPYDPAATSEAENGDWPPNAATLALDYLPEELDGVIGEERDAFPNPPFLHISPESQDALVAQLVGLGFAVRRDDEVIVNLC